MHYGAICIDPDDHFRAGNYEYYPLMKQGTVQGCKFKIEGRGNDTRWMQSGASSLYAVTEDNAQLKETLGQLAGYRREQDKTVEVNLFFRTFIEWKLKCEEKSYAKISKIADENNPVNTVLNAQMFYLIISFLAVVVVGCLAPIFIVYKHVRVLRENAFENEVEVIVSGGMRIIGPLFVFLKLAFLAACMIIINNFERLASLVESEQCSDPLTIAIFDDIDDAMQEAYRYDVYCLVVVSIMGGMELFTIVLLCALGYRERARARRVEGNDFHAYSKLEK